MRKERGKERKEGNEGVFIQEPLQGCSGRGRFDKEEQLPH